MVRPEYRLRGIASELLRQTLSRLNRPLVECVTRTPHICSLLSNAGFRCYGWDKKKGYYYYLYSTQLNLSDFVKNFYVLSEKYA
jgi:GNAT superfamily N-acetyltransferase